MQRFTASDGLQSNEFNIRAAARIGDDIIIGGIGGINTYNAKKLISYMGTAPAVVNKVTINNKRVIDDPNAVELSPEDKIIEFSFTSFDFTSPELNQFEYRLLGFDSDWINNSSSRTATYTNLDAGNYNFQVRLMYAGRDQTFSLPMVVKPPFWKSLWAYVGYGVILIVLGLLARRNIVNRERLNSKLELEQLKLTKLEELDDFKSKFFANISHEFRTPLTLILGHTGELMEDGSINKETLHSIRNNSHTVLNLVNQLLDLSKIDAGKLNLHIYKVEVVTFLQAYVEMFESLAHQKEIELSTSFPKSEQRVFVDPSLLEKIVVNLLSNAIKYSKPGDKVNIIVSIEIDELTLEVEDTGEGIAHEDLERIFDRFYRVSHHGDGTGIGLSLTKELVTLHKGTIRAFSKHGEGSKFQVKLPVALSNYPEVDYSIEDYDELKSLPGLFNTETLESSLKDQIGEEAPILLIVEDNVELQRYLERNLKHDFNIILASTGGDGLVKSNLAVPDIILSDWMMPGMDGEEMCSKLKSNEVTSHIPIVMLTAKADLDSKIAGLEIGADDYITKPFEMRELKARLNNLIAQRMQLKEKYSQLSKLNNAEVATLSLDEQFLNRLYKIVEDNLSNSQMNVDWLSREMGVSRMQLHRKLTALLGKSGTLLLREYKLERAAELLRGKAGNVSEIAYQVGFNNLSYFTKVFKDKYRVTPSEFA
jgi:signal transduction histidine kinase/DNA-binding response OmpR family regulator